MWTRLRSVLRTLFGRDQFEDEMRAELRLHVEERADDLRRQGLAPADAMRRARMELGSLDSVKDDCRQARGLGVFDELRRDVTHATRVLRKTPGLTITALATLALCIGANLTIFAVVDAVLLRPLPFPDSNRLVRLYNTYPKAGVPDDGASIANYYERRGQIAAVASLAEYRQGSAIVGEPGATERESLSRISPEFFATLGVPLAGREFTDADMTPEASHVVILTDAYWRQRLGGDSASVGRTVRVNGVPHTVVGILPADYRFLSSTSRLYLPLASDPEQRVSSRRHNGSNTHMVARLAPGVSLAEAQAQIDSHNGAMEAHNPQAAMMADAGFQTVAVSLHDDHVASIRPVLLLVQAGALVLLLIGVGNLVNLLLIRTSGRARELAVRQAIGASRFRVAVEVLVEIVVLTCAGGVLGLAVGAAGTRLLAVLGSAQLPLGAEVAFDVRIAAIAMAGTLVVGLLMGIPIAWFSSRGGLANAVQFESRGATANRAAQRLRQTFVVAQVALAFVLLSGSGLLVVSLARAMALSPGFRADSVLSGRMSLPAVDYPDRGALLAFTDRLTMALGQQPGVRAAGVATNVPLSGNSIRSAAQAVGYVPGAGESPQAHFSYGVSGDYFDAMGLSLVAGRYLTTADSSGSQRVCVVDDDYARRYWPAGSAIGQRVFQGGGVVREEEAFTIVGIVGAVKQAALTDTSALGAVYYPLGYQLDRDLFVVTRTVVPPVSFASSMRQVTRGIDPELSLSDLQSMQGRMDDSLFARRSPALLAAVFAALALLLTAIGTYGVLSYAVAHRQREIGLRMALGARPDQVRRQFLAMALRLVAAGIAVGLVGAWTTGRLMQGLLFEVSTFHPATIVGTAGVMVAVALLACLLPSHRAARVSPMEALAHE